jgi:hypothetical protein
MNVASRNVGDAQKDALCEHRMNSFVGQYNTAAAQFRPWLETLVTKYLRVL